MKKKYIFDNPDFDRRIHKFWKALERCDKKENPFKGMTTTEIMRKIRAN